MFENFRAATVFCLASTYSRPAFLSILHLFFPHLLSLLFLLRVRGVATAEVDVEGIGSSESELDASECEFSEDSDPMALESEMVAIRGTSGGRVVLA